jgi:hypothetical protein
MSRGFAPMTEPLPSPDDRPPSAPPGAAGTERRRAPRRACPARPALSYVPWPGSLGRLGYALSVSAEGISFLAEGPLRPGSVLGLQLLWGLPSASRTRVARVAYCAAGEEGGWRVGCEVSPPFSPEELASLL